MNTLSLRDPVAQIVRDVAETEILPRFRNLADHEVAEKSRPGDVVTAADTAAEIALERALVALLPGSLIVGEEAAETAPDVMDRLGSDAPVWVLDPVDGTRNFVAGRECFAVIVALVQEGRTLAGWVYDPVAGLFLWAGLGQGAWVRHNKGGGWDHVKLRTDIGDVRTLKGSVPKRLRETLAPWPGGLTRYFCVGREYMDAVLGRIDFAVYGGVLKPWDHAAGLLAYNEAGGYSALTGDAVVYSPARIVKNCRLLLAPNERSWQSLRSEITGG